MKDKVNLLPPDYVKGQKLLTQTDVDSYSWPQMMVNFDKAHAAGLTGKGVKWGYIDTGWTPHEGFPIVPPEKMFSSSFNTAFDDEDHGTMVATLVVNKPGVHGPAGGAYNVDVHVAKELDSSGAGSFYGVAKSIEWLRSQDCKVINLSLGYRDPNYKHAELDRQLALCRQEERVVIVASGNDAQGMVGYPANNTNVIAIGAIDRNTIVANFSNRGVTLDFVAPGVKVISKDRHGDLRPVDGTSFASPIASAVACLIVEYLRIEYGHDPTFQQVIDYMLCTTKDIHIPGFDTHTGFGITNANVDDCECLDCEEPTERPCESSFWSKIKQFFGAIFLVLLTVTANAQDKWVKMTYEEWQAWNSDELKSQNVDKYALKEKEKRVLKFVDQYVQAHSEAELSAQGYKELLPVLLHMIGWVADEMNSGAPYKFNPIKKSKIANDIWENEPLMRDYFKH